MHRGGGCSDTHLHTQASVLMVFPAALRKTTPSQWWGRRWKVIPVDTEQFRAEELRQHHTAKEPTPLMVGQ